MSNKWNIFFSKKVFLLVINLFLLFNTVQAADLKRSVVLNNDYKVDIYENSCCNIITRIENDKFSGDFIHVSVEIDNTKEKENILLFLRSFTNKDLKAQRPSLRFDKNRYGRMSQKIESCTGVKIKDEVILLKPSDIR